LEEGSRKSAPSAPKAPSARSAASVYRRLLRIAYRDPIEIGDLQVDGEDLAAAGVPKGPALGGVLRHLLDSVIAEPSRNRRDHLLAAAAEWLAAKRDSTSS
ncbi:MAG: hypothetical protein ACYC5V_12585, partial [Gemmatimonadaceae bacterium]